MKKKEFLDELDRILTKRKYVDKAEVLKDFEEHFNLGEQEGKSEEEIAKLLGNPEEIAEQFKEDGEEIKNNTNVVSPNMQTTNQVKTENSTFAKLMLAIALIFFNVVFVLGIVARTVWSSGRIACRKYSNRNSWNSCIYSWYNWIDSRNIFYCKLFSFISIIICGNRADMPSEYWVQYL